MLLDSRNVVSQLLLAHMVALQLILRPIFCRERKHYTVTMFSIRMTTWIETISNSVGPKYQSFLMWPILISERHFAGTLEKLSLAQIHNPT